MILMTDLGKTLPDSPGKISGDITAEERNSQVFCPGAWARLEAGADCCAVWYAEWLFVS